MVQPYEGLYVSLYQHWWGPDWNVDLRLAVSRDGLHFSRVQPQVAVLPLGAAGHWDSGMLCTPNFVFKEAGKLWLYYRGSVGTLGVGRVVTKSSEPSAAQKQGEMWRMYTGLARLREDGFTFLTPSRHEPLAQPADLNETPRYRMPMRGTLLTIPIDAKGISARRLHVNVENFAPRWAWLRAELRDVETGKPLPGYAFADCDPVDEGSLDRIITWRGSPALAEVKAKRIRVAFQVFGSLDSPQLYAFWFSD
jgi:hypothetical protein